MKARRRRGRRRARPLEDLGDILGRALSQVGLTDQARSLRLAKLWKEAVGAHMASRTAVQSFSRGTLWVKAATPAWQNELTYLKDDILAKLQALTQKRMVRELKVISGSLTHSNKPAPYEPPITPQHRAAARELAAPIADTWVREAFESLLIKHFRKKRRD